MSMIPITSIIADNAFNVGRGELRPADVIDLARDMESQGLLQPVIVQPIPGKDGLYRLVAGFRRYTAAQLLKWKEIDASILTNIKSEAEAQLINLSENLIRKDLNIVQEAKVLQRLRELGMSDKEIADKLNKSKTWVVIRFQLLELPELVQREVAAGLIRQQDIASLLAIYRLQGLERCYEAVRQTKGNTFANKKEMYEKFLLKKTTKKVRNKSEIFNLLYNVMHQLGPGLYTVCLGWAAGENDDNELYEALESYGDSIGKVFERPMDVTKELAV